MSRDQRDDRLMVELLQSRQKPGVELSDARLEFERRRLMARLVESDRKTAWTWRTVVVGGFAGAAAVAAVAALIIVFAGQANLAGGPDVNLAGEWHLENGDAISDGARVIVPRDGKATIVLADGTRIWAKGGSSFVMAKEDGSRVRLEEGRILASVAKRDQADPFEIVAGDTFVQVLGTLFSVESGSDTTTVRLHEGRVKVESEGQVLNMRPGHKVEVAQDGKLSMFVIEKVELLADRDLEDVHVRALVMEAASLPEPVPAANEVEPTAPEQVESLVPSSDVIIEGPDHAGTPKKNVAVSAAARKLKEISDLWDARRYDRIVELTDGVGSNPRLLFFRGKALRKLGRWIQAGEVFNTVATMDPVRRAEALYLSAGAYGRAREHGLSLEMAQLAIEAGGPNADHAWRLKIAALSGQGRYQAASSSAREYLERYPAGAHVGDARFALSTGFRLIKDWGNAAQNYAWFAGRGVGSKAMRDDARFYEGYCLVQHGNTAQGRDVLGKYLASYPTGRHASQAQAMLAR